MNLNPYTVKAAFNSLSALPNPVVVQIGACDGTSFDLINPFLRSMKRGRAILFEPLPHLFSRLQANYAGCDWVTPVCAAVSDRGGPRQMHYIDPDGAPDWAIGVGSLHLDKNALSPAYWVRHGKEQEGKQLLSRMQSTTVSCLSFGDVLTNYGLSAIDFLQIDAEGHEATIISAVPWDKVRPRWIHFEASTMPPEDLQHVEATLLSHGYRIIRYSRQDWLAIDGTRNPLSWRIRHRLAQALSLA